MVKALETLKAQESKLNKDLQQCKTAQATSEAKTEDEADQLQKAEAKLAMFERLHSQLHERKAQILEERAKIFKDDEEQRTALSAQLKERIAAFDTQRLVQAVPASGDADTAADGAAEAVALDPYKEQVRLRTELLQLADGFERDEAVAKRALEDGAAQRHALEVELAAVLAEMETSDARIKELNEQSVASMEAEKAHQEEINGFTRKFASFNELSHTASADFAARASALSEAAQSARQADIALRHTKLIRAEHAKGARPPVHASCARLAPAAATCVLRPGPFETSRPQSSRRSRSSRSVRWRSTRVWRRRRSACSRSARPCGKRLRSRQSIGSPRASRSQTRMLTCKRSTTLMHLEDQRTSRRGP